ncbi:MAG: AraC family transcriptional regulator [Oxalobacteraceae bacterium]|nr:MAG: AraC family transcriptional regulator [Oxalobacteraceae bacterium]
MPNHRCNIYEDFANRISSHVQAHLDRDIVIDDLASTVGVSKYHLNRLFKATTGFQIGEFIQRRRLQHAHALLASGDYSVIDASLAVNYDSHSSFSRAFLKAFGCRPNQVRLGSACVWRTPDVLKRACTREAQLQPVLVDLPEQRLRGLYGSGFKDQSFHAVGTSLFDKIGKRLARTDQPVAAASRIGVSLESPWQTDQDTCRFFAGLNRADLELGFDDYLWAAGSWARFRHTGPYRLIWQTISRVYAGWVIPEGICLKDDAVVQVYLTNPATTRERDLCADLYFPVQTPM